LIEVRYQVNDLCKPSSLVGGVAVVTCQNGIMAVCDVVVNSGMWVPTFRRNVPPPCSGKNELSICWRWNQPCAPAAELHDVISTKTVGYWCGVLAPWRSCHVSEGRSGV